MYKDYEKLTNLNFDSFIKNRNDCIVSYLEGATGIDLSTENKKIRYATAASFEQIPTLMLPQSLVSISWSATSTNLK